MNYADALKEANNVGASKAEGLPLLAMTLKALAAVHAINPEMAFNGAVKRLLNGQ